MSTTRNLNQNPLILLTLIAISIVTIGVVVALMSVTLLMITFAVIVNGVNRVNEASRRENATRRPAGRTTCPQNFR